MHNHALVMVRGSRFALVTCEAGEAALARVLYLGIRRLLYFILSAKMKCTPVCSVGSMHYAVMRARCVGLKHMRASLDLEHLINTLPMILSRHMTRAD